MDIGNLCDKFEQEAKALGYELEALALYNKREDRHQINWNDKIAKKDIPNVCENLALVLWKVAQEDKDTVLSAIATTHFYTKEGARQLAESLAEGLANFLEGTQAEVKEIANTGLEAGEKLAKAYLEGGKNDGE